MKENVTHTLGVTLNIYATGTTGTEQNENKKKTTRLNVINLPVCRETILYVIVQLCWK